MNGFLSQVSEKEHFRSKCSAQRVKMATLKIRMVIGLIALLIGGLSLNAVAQSNYPVVKKTTPTDTIKFYNGDELVRTQVVIAGDNLYEPESPAVRSNGEVFTGWYKAGETTPLNFVNGVLQVASVSGTTVVVNAGYTLFRYATFLDQDGHVLSRLSVENGGQIGTPPTLIPKQATESFKGWSLTNGSTSTSDAVTFPVTLNSNATYYPIIQSGHYIHFDANRSHVSGMNQVNVSYTAPIFVREGEPIPSAPTPPVADIAAYTFDKWYTDPECTHPFTWSGQLTNDITLYANWNVGQVHYNVVIWQQRVTDDKNATGNARHWDYICSFTGTADIGSTITYNNNLRYTGNTSEGGTAYVSPSGNNNTRINNITFTGFDRDDYDQSITVKADGSSVLNVYYKRKLMTINFHVKQNYYGTWDWNSNASNSDPNWRTITGLYGATFEQSVGTETPDNYKWPFDHKWYDGSMNQTLLTAFTMTENPYNLVNRGTPGDAAIYHVRQKVDGSWPTNISEEAHISLAMGTVGNDFTISRKFNNFTPVGYQRNIPTSGNLSAPGTSGTEFTETARNAVYHERDKYPLVFYNGSEIVSTELVYYEAPLSSHIHADLIPDDPARYSFGGWSLSPDKHSENDAVDLSGRIMPAPSLRLYAIWVPIAYNVQLSLGEGLCDATLNTTCDCSTPSNCVNMNSSQSRDFWPTYGATIDNTYMSVAERDGYTLVGWFDPDNEPWDFANPVTKDLCDEGPTYDPAYQNYYYTLHLTAKWRLKANISMVYDLNNGTAAAGDSYVDNELYVQYGDVMVLPGTPTPPTGDGVVRHFTGWVDEMGNLHQPGTTFTLDDEHLFASDPTNPNRVVAKLTAQYTTDIPKVTITYKPNYTGSTEADVIRPASSGYDWRERVTLLGDNTFNPREGYTFLGWSRTANATEPDFDFEEEVLASAMGTDIEITTNIGNTDLYAVWREELTMDDAACINETITLPSISDAGNSGTWAVVSPSTASISTDNKLSATAAGEYTLTFTSSVGNVITKTVTFYALPTITASASPTNICPGETATLTATSETATTFSWDNDLGEGSTKEVSPTETKTYHVTGTIGGENGCSNTAEVTVTVNAAPTVTMSDITMCATTGTVSLLPTVTNAQGTVQYKWDDATEYGTTSSITINTASATTETHTVTVKDNRNCPVTATATVTVNANPTVAISDVTNQTCTEKGLFTATVVGGQTPYQYKLDDQDKYYGDNTAYTFTGLEANLTTTPASSKTYTVKVVDYNGCFGTATQSITLNSEEITLEDINVTVCSGFTFSQRLTDNVDVKYKWSAPSPVNCLTGGEASDGLEDYFHGQLSLAEGCSSGTATYSVTPSLGVCTLNVVSVQVGAIFTVRPPVSVEITDPGKVCAGSSQTFTATLSNAVANSKLTWNFNGEIYEETLSESTTPQTHTHSFTVPSTSATATTCANTATLLVSYADVVGDACHADDNQTITIGVPEWSVPAAGSSEVTCIADLETPTPPAKQDFCGNDLDITLTSVSPNNPKTAIECSGEVVYTFTYSDCEGTENTWTHTVTVTGPDKPVITLAEGVSDSQNLGCTPSSIPDITAESFTVTDQCNSGAEAVVTEGNVVSDGCNRTKVWTANYSNCKEAADPVTITQTWKVTKTLTITANLTANAIAIGSCKYKIPNLEELTLDNTTETCSTAPTFSQNPVANKEYEQTDEEQTIPVTVTVTDDCDNTATQTINVIIPAKPKVEVSLNGAETICAGGSVELKPTATVTPNTLTPTWNWYEGTGTTAVHEEQNYTVTPAATTTYRVVATVTDNGCEVTGEKTVTVTVNPLPQVTMYDLSECQGTNRYLEAWIHIGDADVHTEDVTGYSFSWQDGNTAPVRHFAPLKPSDAGTYTLTVTETATGCSGSASKEVTVYPKPEVSIDPVSQLCPKAETQQLGITINTAGTPEYNYTWDGGGLDLTNASTATPTINIPEVCDQTYTVTLYVRDSHSCKDTATTTIKVADAISPLIEKKKDTEIAVLGTNHDCVYLVPDLTDYTHVQYGDGCSKTVNIKQHPAAGDTITTNTDVTITVSDNCEHSNSVTIQVTIPEAPAVEITVPTEDVCPAAEFTVTANITSGAPDYSYIWNNVPNSIEYANTMGTVSTSTITATASAYGCGDTKNVKIEVTDANGCVAEASTTVKVKSLDPPTISTALTDKNWGCTAPTTPQASDFTVENDECGNGTFSLTHGDTIKTDCTRSLKWTAYYRNRCGNSTTKEITYTWTVDTEAPVIADIPDQNATAIGSCKYQIPDLSAITLANTTETCHATFVSQSRLSTEEIEQTNAQQTISVTVTVKDDCYHEATQTVNVIIPAKSETTPAITLGDSVVCSGGSVTMKPTVTPTGYTYNWTWKEGTNTVASTQNYSVTPTATTTYTVNATATTDNGCELEASKTVTVTVNDVAEATINGNDFCQGGSTTLSVPAGASAYAWAKDGTTITGANTNELNVTEAGTYTVTVTAEGGCTSVGSKTVKMNPLPTVTINNVPQLCPSTTSYTLGCVVTGTAPYTYAWSSASTDLTLDNTAIATPTATIPAVCDGSYTVKLVVTDKNNCSSNEASRNNTVKDETTPTITLSQTSVNATPVAGCTYQVPDVTTLVTVSDACTKQELVVTQSPAATTVITATQDVTVTVSDGCHTNTATIRVVVPNAMALTALTGATVNPLCKGDANGSITVNTATGGTPAYTYAIDGGTASTALTFSGLAAGSHTITATDAYGCTATLTVTLTEPDVLTATVTTTQETCTGHDGKATVSANGGTEGYTFEWSNGATGTNQDTLTSFGPNHGVYTVTVTDAHNCHANATATITLNNPLTMNELSTVVCSGYEFSITPVNGTDGYLPAGTTYTWEAPSATANPDVASGLAGATEADRINGTITLNSDVTHPVTIVYAVTPENGVCVGEATNVSVTVNATVNPKVTITIPHHLNKCNSGTYDLTAEFVNGYSAYDVVWLRNGDTIASSRKHNAADVTSDVFSVNLNNTSCGSEYVYRVAYTDESGCTAADECKISITSGTWSIGTPDGSSTVACLDDASAPVIPNTVVDSCDREITGVLLEGYPQDNPTIITCNGTRTYKYRYTACDGSHKDWTYTYTIKDTVKPNLLITSTPAPEAAGNCQYKIPAVVYTASDCNTYTVTQTPAANETVDQEATAKTVEITLNATDACGNDSVVKTTVTIPAKPTVEATVNPAAICLNETATVSATVTGTTDTPTWTVVPATGTVSGNTFTATADGLYTLTASVTENGCTVSDDATVTVNPLATLNITDAATKQEQLISYGTNIDPVEITNTESNVTLTPAYGTSDWPAGFEYNETTQVITSNLPAAGIYTFVAKATSLYGCDPVTQTIKVTVTEDSNPIVIRSSTKEWTYDGETHTDEVYTVTYNGANMAVDATGKVFTLPTGDKVTITPTAAGVTHVDSYSENNTYTYTIEHGTQYTSVTTFVGTLSINCRKVTLTSGTDSKTYDGTELKKETVTVAGDGWLTGKEATYSNFASVTYVSSIENTFDYALAAGENADDYCVTVNNGTLTVSDGTGPGEDPVDPALVVSKTASTTSVYNLGDVVTFTVTATNIYNEPKTITFTELPGVTLSQSVFDNVASGETVTATATYTITENDLLEGSFTNTVTAQLGNIEKTADKTVNTEDPNGHLAVTKVATSTPADGTKYNLGETISYKVTVTNDGNLTITNITVTDPLTGDSWNVATLAPNAYEEFTTSHTVTEADILAGHVLNEATATGTSPDPKKPDVPVAPGSDDEPTGTAPLVIKINATKVYDGTPLQVPFDTITGVTTTGLMSGDALTAGSVTSSGSAVGTYTYTSGDATINTPFNTALGIDYYTVTYEINLTITKKALLIELDSTKMYDGTKFRVTYDQLYTTGLVDGDYLASGNMWTESYQYNDTTYSGIHVGEYENNDGSFEAVEAIVGYVAKAGFSVKDAGGSVVTSSYVPKFKVKLKIVKRPITITAASDSKPYDGTDLTNSGHSITSGALATGDSYTATVTGAQLCKGTKNNVPSGAVITRGTENVNDDYTISYVNGTLTVTDVDPGQFICPTAETFELNDCETSTSVTLVGTPTVTGVAAGHYTFVNNLTNPLSEGTHTITWSLLDDCGNEVGSCTQDVTVKYKECTGVTWQGHPYDAVRIGSQCWFTENLQWNTGSAVAYGEDAANVGKFGYLYTWYTAVGVPENDNTTAPTTQNDDCGNPYVQGICPPGWAVGSQADYDLLNTTAGSTSNLKDPSTEYWQAGYEGVTGGTGFNARGGGWYNSALSRYEDIMTGYHFWNSDSNPGTTVNSSTIVYYCDEILTVQAQKTDKMSVRCIRKKQ